MKKWIEALHPFGDVLEVGFSSASSMIEKYLPHSHTMIEPHAEKAKLWAQKHKGVKIIEDIWQSALGQLGVFDTIFFGIDPPEIPPHMKIRYTDHELDTFCQAMSPLNKTHVSRFLAELEQVGQISDEQQEKMIQKYHLTKVAAPRVKRSSQMLQFLKLCLASHMRKGSRFSCFLKHELDDPQFFNEIIVDPNLDYREDGMVIVIEKVF